MAGTISNPLLLASETVAALVAAKSSVTVQVLDALFPGVEGPQATDVSVAGAEMAALSAKLCETPLRVAVSKAFWLEVTGATAAVKAAVLSPELMLTLPGAVMFALLLSTVTLAAPGVAAVKVIVQSAVPGAFTIAGTQVRVLICAAAAKVIIVCWLWPLKLAVKIAVWPLLAVPEVALKVAVLWPGATVILAGTVTKALLLASETVAALVTALFSATVQAREELLPGFKGAQASEESWAGPIKLNVLVRINPPALAVITPA